MLQLKSLHLKNLVLFEDQDFTFEEGTTLITGRNRTGKSLLLSPLKSLLCGTNSEDTLPTGSTAVLRANSMGADGSIHRLKIEGDTPKSKTNWKLHVNTQNMDTHRSKDCRSLINEYVRLTPEIFNVVCHIMGSNPPPLRFGTPSFKLEWVSNLFNLTSSYTLLEERVAARLVKSAEAEVALKYAKSNCVKPEKPDLANLIRTEKLAATMQKSLQGHLRSKSLQEELSALRVKLKSLSARQTQYTSKKELDSRLRTLSNQLSEFKDRQDELDTLERQRNAWAKKKDKFNALCKGLDEKPTSPKHLKQLIDACNNALRVFKDKMRSYSQDVQAYKDYLEALPSVSQPFVTEEQFATLERRQAHYDVMRNNALDIIQSLKNVSSDVCPECGNHVTEKHKKTVLSREKDKLAMCDREQAKLKRTLVLYNRQQLCKDKVEKPTSRAMLGLKIEKLTDQLSRLNEIYDLDLGPKPPAINTTEFFGPKISKVRTEIDSIENDLRLLESMGEDSFSEDSKDIKLRILGVETKLNKIQPFDMDAYTRVSEKLARLKMLKTKYDADMRDYTKKMEEIEVLQKASRHVRPLKVLKEAFGKTGLRLSSLTDSLQVLMQELNNLSPLLFDEKFKFDVETGPRRLNMLIERNGRVSGMRGMSMSELRCWTLLFSTAMLKLLPSRMLTDTLILDEMESNMDPINKARYLKEFIPYLQTIVPKVIVVSPLIGNELSLQPDRAYMVEKKNNVSTLKRL
jgi:hypothetical protein